MSFDVILPAAGTGKRMGLSEKKQFLSINNLPIVIHTVKLFDRLEQVSQIILVVSKDDVDMTINLISEYNFSKKIKVIVGGSERQESVYKALSWAESPYILIHDAVRPLLKRNVLNKLLEASKSHDAITLGVPVKDTIKKVNVNDLSVINTLDRSQLWAIQTPQIFKSKLLKQSHEKALKKNIFATDDASLVESMGGKVYLVMGDYDNIKITTIEDLNYAKFLLQSECL